MLVMCYYDGLFWQIVQIRKLSAVLLGRVKIFCAPQFQHELWLSFRCTFELEPLCNNFYPILIKCWDKMRYQVLTDQKVREKDNCRQISNSKKKKYELIVQKKLHFPWDQSSSVCLSYQGKTFNYQPAEAASESSSRENNGAHDNATVMPCVTTRLLLPSVRHSQIYTICGIDKPKSNS